MEGEGRGGKGRGGEGRGGKGREGEGRGGEGRGRRGKLIHAIGPKHSYSISLKFGKKLSFDVQNIDNENDDCGGDDNNDDNIDGDNSPLLKGSRVDSETQALRVE